MSIIPESKRLVLSLLIMLALYSGVYIVHDVVGLSRWLKSGSIESRMTRTSDSTAAFLKAIPSDFVSAPFPVSGDTVLRVDGFPLTRERYVRFIPSTEFDIQPFPANRALVVDYLHEGKTLRTAFAMRKPAPMLAAAYVLVDGLRHLIILSMLFVAWWGLYSRGDHRVVQIFALYCLSRAGESASAYFFPLSYGLFPHSLMYALQSWIPALFDSLTVSFWLHLQYVFPRPLEWVRRNPRLAYTLCYLPAALSLIMLLRGNIAVLRSALPAFITSGEADSMLTWGFLLAGVAILVYRYYTTSDHVERRQLRLFIGGSAVGLIASATVLLLYVYFFDWYDSSPYVDLVASGATYVAILLGPLSFAYAFRRYRLMDIEGKLKRGTRYALVTLLLFSVAIGAIYTLSRLALEEVGIDRPGLMLAIGFGLALGFLPVQQRINAYVERRFFPERANLRRLLQEFFRQTPSMLDQTAFWNALERELKDGLKVRSVYPLRIDDPLNPFQTRTAVARELIRTHRVLLLDEAISAGDILLDSNQLDWLREHRIGMLLPAVLHDRLIAVIAISLRADDEDYDSEELQILNACVSQIAIAAENLRLIEENYDKRRMELELGAARSTQIGLLPQVIPDCPGLEIAAVCHFCLEVAGDYYDVIPLANGRTCIAIGDVSGKGASASLLMASLQSSLNTAIPFGIPLADIVGRINTVICRNTPPEKFITFFVGVFDPQTKLLSYVNAGHDQPVLTRADGSHELLDQGGVVLGCVPGWEYAEGHVLLAPADAILLYTDGVRETWNPQAEEFGLERLTTFAREHRALPCETQVRRLEDRIISFHGSDRFDDDFTLLMLKAT